MKDKKRERRYTKRLAIGIEAEVYRLGKDASHILDAYLLETKDIAQKGVFLRTARPFPLDTKLRLNIKFAGDEKVISAEGKVAWIAKRSQKSYYPGMGIEITRIERGEAKKLKDFLKNKFCNYHHAVKLKKMYLQLKEMAANLYDMEESHPQAEHFRTVIDRAIKEIDYIAHLLDREVWEVKSL